MVTIFAVFLLLPMTTGFVSYVCSGTSDESVQHNLYCKEEARINIINGLYGFKYSWDFCSRDCYYQSPYCDCRPKFNPSVESNLMDSCNGKKTCDFQTPKPYITCYKEDNFNNRIYYTDYTYSYIEYECLTVRTTLPTRRTINTREQGTTTLTTRRTINRRKQGTKVRVYTVNSTIHSTKQDNSRPQPSTSSYTDQDRSGRTEAVLYTTEINNVKTVNHNQDTADKAVIAGSVVGCVLLVLLVFIVVVFILKRKTIGDFIDSHFKDSSRLSNPVYEAPGDGYNNVIFKNDNSPSVSVVKSDDYNHLHDIKNGNSMTTGNTYNHMGQMGGDYNHLHANNNGLPFGEQSDGTYNHLGMVNFKTHNSDYNHLNGLRGHDNISEEVCNDNYNHLGDVKVDKPDVDYNHLNGGKSKISKTDYHYLGENKKSDIPNDDYNHIGGITNDKTDDNYHHLGNGSEHVVNEDDYNHIGNKKHDAIVEYELAHNGDLHVQEEQTPDDVQYEIADDETGDYSNISEQQSNYENIPISGHQTCG